MTSLKIFRSILKRWHVPFMHLTTQPSKRVLLAWTDHSWLKYRTCLTEGGQKFGWPWDQSLVWLVLPLAGQYKYHSEVCGHTPPIQIYPSSFCAYWAYSTFAQRKAVLIGTSGEKSRITIKRHTSCPLIWFRWIFPNSSVYFARTHCDFFLWILHRIYPLFLTVGLVVIPTLFYFPSVSLIFR